MEKLLQDQFGLEIHKIVPCQRKDTGNQNAIYQVKASEGIYFLKELPSHSVRDDIDTLYLELSRCKLKHSKMVLPLKTKKNTFLFHSGEKQMMLYPFIEHRVLDEVEVEIEKLFICLEDLFTGLESLEIPEYPFKTCQNWFERGLGQLRKKVSTHRFLDLFEDFIQNRFSQLNFKSGNVHFDFNPFNICVDENNEVMLSDFDNAQIAAYAKDIFDACSVYVRESESEVMISKSDQQAILNFCRKYISNIEMTDINFLLVRPKLGALFDPLVDIPKEILEEKLDLLYQFCLDSTPSSFVFKRIDMEGFIRIWNRDYEDALADSHKKAFSETSEDEWKPIFDRHLKVMREVELDGKTIGYIFLSPKSDGTAHLGYGLYKDHRGRGLSVDMCQQFLAQETPKLNGRFVKILATALETNQISQKVLSNLGFQNMGKLNDPDFDYIRFEKKII